MKSFAEFVTTISEASEDVDNAAQQAVIDMQQALGKLFPEHFRVQVRYESNPNPIIFVKVTDERDSEATWGKLNSANRVHLMLNLVNAPKVSVENVGSHFPQGVKFRKGSSASIAAAAKKVVTWFKKNQKAFQESETEDMFRR